MLLRYVNQPQPELQGSSVTLKATQDRIEHMHREADLIWPPQLAQLMKVNTLCFYTTETQWASGLLSNCIFLASCQCSCSLAASHTHARRQAQPGLRDPSSLLDVMHQLRHPMFVHISMVSQQPLLTLYKFPR